MRWFKVVSLVIVVAVSLLYFDAAVFAAEKEAKKDAQKEVKITGLVESVPADASGKLADFAIKSEDGQYLVIQNSIATKIKKKMGKKLDVTGIVESKDGKKIITPWNYKEHGIKPPTLPAGG